MKNRETQELILPEESKRINVLRFILTIFVFFIHNNITNDDVIPLGISFTQPQYVSIIKFIISDSLALCAVPLFFLFSSYLQFKKQNSYISLLKKRFLTIVIPIIVWTIITIMLFAVFQHISKTQNFFSRKENIISNWTFVDYIKAFIGYGRTLNQPLIGPFWFLRDLLILIIVSPFLYWLLLRLPIFTIITSFLGAFVFKINYFIVNPQSVFFYICGCYIAINKRSLFYTIDKIQYKDIFLLYMLVLISGYFNFRGYKQIVTLLSCIFMLKISDKLIKYETLVLLGNYSFFLYAMHEPVLLPLLNKISLRILPMNGIFWLIQYLLPSIICFVLELSIAIILQKFIPVLYTILSGARKVKKNDINK